MEKNTFLFAGNRHNIKRNTVANSYLELDNEESLTLYVISSEKVEEFEKANNIIRLDQDVFERLQTTRTIKDENNELTQVIIELPDNLKRTIRYDYNIMTREFNFKTNEAFNYINQNYKERSKKRI